MVGVLHQQDIDAVGQGCNVIAHLILARLHKDRFAGDLAAGVAGRRIGLPPMTLLYFDAAPDRLVDTESVCRPWTPGLGRYYDWLLRRFLRAAEAGDDDGLFDCITASAEYNQTVVALPRWEEWLRLATESRCGLMVAHSGTFAGLLVPPERAGGMRARLEVMTGAPVFVEQP